jgi:hypothetical protein
MVTLQTAQLALNEAASAYTTAWQGKDYNAIKRASRELQTAAKRFHKASALAH